MPKNLAYCTGTVRTKAFFPTTTTCTSSKTAKLTRWLALQSTSMSLRESLYNGVTSSAVAISSRPAQKSSGVTLYITCGSEAQCSRIIASADKLKWLKPQGLLLAAFDFDRLINEPL